MAAPQARGLHNFISEIRNTQNKDAEIKRVEKELAHIRQKFSSSDKLNSYHKKKYVWKLVYIFVLGYDVDFGHTEAVSLMTSPKYSEKIVGYAAVALMIHPGDDLMASVLTAIKQDLARPDDAAQSLALACVANIAATEAVVSSVAKDVQALLVNHGSHPAVKKKAALCLLRLFRANNSIIYHSEWADRMSSLLEQRHLGVTTSAMSLILGCASRSPADYDALVPYVIHNLHHLVVNRQACRQDYQYYNTPSPWLQVKLLKFLQLYPAPTDPTQQHSLNTALNRIINRTDASESVNKSNADHAVLFESVNLVIHQGTFGDEKLRHQALNLLGRFISVREPNIRYIGLQTMARMAQLEGNERIKKHEATVVVSLKDGDISVRRRALDLLFVMCDEENSARIVDELMSHLMVADSAIREEMVLKIAIVAEKYAKDLTWYVENILQLIKHAGDFVSDDIWHRLIQIVTNNKAVQAFAADKLLTALQAQHVHETLVKVGAYILGEFGFLIAEEAGKSGEDQFHVLMGHFPNIGHGTQSHILSAFVKIANLYEECRPLVMPIFQRYRASGDLEMQQRACEYSALPAFGEDVMEDVLREMPAFPTDRQSALEKRLQEQQEAPEEPPVSAGGGGGSTGWSTKKDAAAPASSAGPAVVKEVAPKPPSNLLDLDETATPPPAAAPGGEVVSIAAADIASMKAWFNSLVVGQQGPLYENQTVQVAVRHVYQGFQARIALYVRNKSGSPMQDLYVALPSERYLVLQTASAMPSSLPAGGNGQMQITGECMLPYEVAPECTISFAVGGTLHKYPLRLPTVATCFMEPLNLQAQDFMQKWEALQGPERERQVVFNSAKPIDSTLLAHIRTTLVPTGLRLGVVEGLDQTEFTLSAAATFRTGTMAPNPNNVNPPPRVSVGCLMRLEANPQGGAFRLTVRAVHGTVSEALKNVVKAQLF